MSKQKIIAKNLNTNLTTLKAYPAKSVIVNQFYIMEQNMIYTELIDFNILPNRSIMPY